MVEDEVAGAWREAVRDLGVTVEAPFEIELPDGSTVTFLALVKDFGCEQGMLVHVLQAYDPALERTASRLGYGVSFVDAEAYRFYSRSIFTEALRDWGWSGDPAKTPEWCQREDR